jgi:hypothetical protein
MLPQGVLGFQYEAERSSTGVTALAGLPLYLDLIHSSGLAAAIRRHIQVAGRQGWLDLQMVLAVVFLNLAGGDCVEDLERLERDSGFAAVLQAIERDLLLRSGGGRSRHVGGASANVQCHHLRRCRPGWSVSMTRRRRRRLSARRSFRR